MFIKKNTNSSIKLQKVLKNMATTFTCKLDIFLKIFVQKLYKTFRTKSILL